MGEDDKWEDLIDGEEFRKYADVFTSREQRLIFNAVGYACKDPAGLPGHNLMIIIHKLMIALCNSKPSLENAAVGLRQSDSVGDKKTSVRGLLGE